MCKCISSHNGLVGLHRHIHQLGHESAGVVDFWGYNFRVNEDGLMAFDRHHHLFQGGISCAFPNSVDGHLYLSCALLDPSYGVGRSHA